jgi:hypothetical protein
MRLMLRELLNRRDVEKCLKFYEIRLIAAKVTRETTSRVSLPRRPVPKSSRNVKSTIIVRLYFNEERGRERERERERDVSAYFIGRDGADGLAVGRLCHV